MPQTGAMTGDDLPVQAGDRSARVVRLRAFLLAAILHALAIVALVRAFAPDFATRAVERVVATFVASPEPSPPPSPASHAERHQDAAAGAAGAAGRRAVPRAVVAPAPRVPVVRLPTAPPVAGAGSADRSGAQAAGTGTGASGSGGGTGSGGAGNGPGDGATAAVKIAGDINSARDYPIASRDLRIGDHVIVALTVGTDGRPTACRVVRASRDAEADAITCRLAQARFRFRPATDAAGQPVVSTYGWQQRWFYKDAP